MVSRNERLRKGESVKLKSGVEGKLNHKEKTLDLATGERLPLSKKAQSELFPQNEEALKQQQTKEGIQGQFEHLPFKDFLFQVGQHGITHGIKDIGNKIFHPPEEQQRIKNAEREISEEIKQKSPWTSRAAHAASFVPDIVATSGLSAAKAAPIISTVSAGSRIFDEPLEVAGEAAVSSLGGKILDKGAAWLGNVAKRRAASKALPSQKEAVKAANELGSKEVAAANAEATQSHNVLKGRVANENAARMHQHELELAARQKKMVEAQEALASTKTHNKSLSDNYKIAQKEYEQSLAARPKLQQEAQEEYSRNVVKNAKKLESNFPKDSKIFVGDIAPNEFLESAVNNSGLAGSTEANQATRIIKSLFPEGETLSAKELSKRYQSIEQAIQRSNPEVQQVLTQFKDHLGQKIPRILEDSIAYKRILPSFVKSVEKDVESVISSMKLDPRVSSVLRESTSDALKGIESNNFLERMQSGEISQEIMNRLSQVENFVAGVSPEDVKYLMSRNPKSYQGVTRSAKIYQKEFADKLAQKMQNNIARLETMGMAASKEAEKKLGYLKGRHLKGTSGMAAPVEPPIPPNPPNLSPETPIPPIQQPQKPSLMENPVPPIPQSFSPQPDPLLSSPQNLAERTGDLLEKKLLGGRSLLNNPFTKLGGLKLLAGKAAPAVAGAYGAAKLLTSPGVAGQAARYTFKQGGIQAIIGWAQRYPSYHDGILEDPQDRRSLAKEIEDAGDIPLEQKALLQSQTYRGKPLDSSI